VIEAGDVLIASGYAGGEEELRTLASTEKHPHKKEQPYT